MGCSSSKNQPKPKVITPEMIGNAVKLGLDESAQYAETMTSHPGRFTDSEQIRISLPEEISKLRPVLDQVEKGEELDKLEKEMNAAAEMACQGCAKVFEGVIKKMDIADAAKLLQDENPASCTDFLREKCEADLKTLMDPPVQRSMEESEVNSLWEAIKTAYKEGKEKAEEAAKGVFGAIADAVEDAVDAVEEATGVDLDGVDEKMEAAKAKLEAPELEFDLKGYIVDKGMDGIFTFIAEKEKELRANPTAAAGELIKEVFKKFSAQVSKSAPVANLNGGESAALLSK